MKNASQKAYNVADLRELARCRLPKGLFEFVDRGTEDEVSLRRNRQVFESIKIKPRTLIDVSRRSQAVTIFGREQKMPIAIGPTGGVTSLMWYDGEIALARAAAAAGIPFTVSTGSMTAMERIVREAGGRLWFQLYMWPDRALSHKLVERVEAAGYEALIVSVDAAALANREYNLRNGYTMPFTFTQRNIADVLMHPRWLCGVLGHYALTSGIPTYVNYPTERKSTILAQPMGKSVMKNDSLSWDDLRALRKMWPRKLIAKGVLNAEDALQAVDCGVDGVIVSNHGGRNLDSSLSPIEVLPDVVNAVGKRSTVMVDSGFRRGSDVVKAVALGAKAVLIGRATLYGLAAAGEQGAVRAIELFRDEIDRVLALMGCPGVAQLDPDRITMCPPCGYSRCCAPNPA